MDGYMPPHRGGSGAEAIYIFAGGETEQKLVKNIIQKLTT